MSISADGAIPAKNTDISNKASLRGTGLESTAVSEFKQDARGTITGVIVALLS